LTLDLRNFTRYNTLNECWFKIRKYDENFPILDTKLFRRQGYSYFSEVTGKSKDYYLSVIFY
jgi:hypothetical protein